MGSPQELSTEELMHLALHETQSGSPEKAIVHLKNLLDIEPKNSNAHYLLGALHAEIGMYDQAREEMEHSLEINPDMPTARFQLGLLYITSGNVEKAENIWQGLDKLGEEHSLFLFKSGMLSLARDEFESCIQMLEAGIEKNTFNEDLNNDMRQVLKDARTAATKQETAHLIPDAEHSINEVSSKQRLLSKYGEQDDD